MELEVLTLAFILSIIILVSFGVLLAVNYGGDPLLVSDDKYTVFLRKNWFWVIPLVAFGIGLLGALTITGAI